VTITDDDLAYVPTVSPSRVSESAGPTDVTVTVTDSVADD